MTRPAPGEIERIRDALRRNVLPDWPFTDTLFAEIDWQAARIRELEKTVADLNKEASMIFQGREHDG